MKTYPTRLEVKFFPGVPGESANAFLDGLAEDMVLEHGRNARPGIDFCDVTGEAMADWLECNANDRNGLDWTDALARCDSIELADVADQVNFALREPSSFSHEQLGRAIAGLVADRLRYDLLTRLTASRMNAATAVLIKRGQISRCPKLTETGELA